ncbi:MAG: hypothetical protein CMC81_02850 [Flavobacteriaceae bacterium]|nr:hypothetical protein [Flavobacteriaceae bacterium]|tara:strand:+ start:9489 stop:9824 length:336 start_codon:yes stop_codon:yes gene_type:complete
MNIGMINSQLNNYDVAIDNFSSVIAIKSDYQKAFIFRASVKLDSRDFAGAIEDNTEAIKIDKSNSVPYANRGKAKEFLEDINGACEDWTLAADLGHKSAKIWVLNQCKNRD